MQKYKGRITCLLILSTLILGLFTGCRHSPLLEQIEYSNNTEKLDLNNNSDTELDKKEDKNNEENKTKQELKESGNTKLDKKEDENNEKQKTKQELKKSGNNVAKLDTKEVKNNEEDKTKQKLKESDSQKDKNQAIDTNSAQQQDSKNDAKQNPEQEGTGDLGYAVEIKTDGALHQVIYANGETVNVPQSVNRVTAVGEAGVMVQMLGGSWQLAASSSSLTQNSLAQKAFGDEFFSGVETLWNDEGKKPLSDDNFQRLLELKPNVCFEISGQTTFSDSQLEQLKANEISYVVLPRLNTSSNIKTAVTVMGSVLGNRSSDGGLDAPANAIQYCEWYDGIIAKVSAKVQAINYDDIDSGYDKYVNPKGIGSWTEGSTESILESIWIAMKYYDAFSESELSAEVKNFYKIFYRHDLSDKQLWQILMEL